MHAAGKYSSDKMYRLFRSNMAVDAANGVVVATVLVVVLLLLRCECNNHLIESLPLPTYDSFKIIVI